MLERSGHDAQRDQGLEPSRRGQGDLARGAAEHQGAADADGPDPLPRGDPGAQGKTEAKAGGTAPGSASSSASTQESKVTTSKKYFQHISLLLDELRSEVKGTVMTPKIAQRLVDKAALEIDRLPVLNVDEELIAYGAGVSATFRDTANLSKNASLDASYRQASMAGNQGYGYGYGGFYGGGGPLSLATSVMQKQETSVLQSNELVGLHHARGKDGGDPQENDAQVQGRVLTRVKRVRIGSIRRGTFDGCSRGQPNVPPLIRSRPSSPAG